MMQFMKPSNGYDINKKGFTLMEIMIALFATSIIISAVYFLFIRVTQMNRDLNQRVEMQDAMRYVSVVIEKDVRTSTQYLSVEEISEDNYDLKVFDDKGALLNTINYKTNNNVIYRNDQHLMNNISSIKLVSTDHYVYFEVISTIEDKEDHYAKKFYLRQN